MKFPVFSGLCTKCLPLEDTFRALRACQVGGITTCGEALPMSPAVGMMHMDGSKGPCEHKDLMCRTVVTVTVLARLLWQTPLD